MTSSYLEVADLASAIEAMRCLQADVRLNAAFAATRSIAIEGCKVDHVFQRAAPMPHTDPLLRAARAAAPA